MGPAEEGTYDPNAEGVARPPQRPTPELDVHHQIHTHTHPGESRSPPSPPPSPPPPPPASPPPRVPAVELMACALSTRSVVRHIHLQACQLLCWV